MGAPSTKTKRERPNVGRAVVDGKVRFTSVSQIKTFDPASDGGCNRKWAFQYVFGKKLPRVGAQTRGSEHAETFEHYLTTGEDVLPPVLQAAKKFFPRPGPDLECEEPLGDLERAVKLRDEIIKLQRMSNLMPDWRELVRGLEAELAQAAGLTAAGIPVDGAADVRHARDTYIDNDGLLKYDPPGAVIKIKDLKTTSRIFPHKILKGPNAGTILPSYTKTDAEVCEDTQMIGYARHAVNRYPSMTHARLSLIYANTTKREAVQRGGIISVARIIERWNTVEDVVKQIEQVAGAQKIEDVAPNIRACDAYTHVDPTDDPINPKKPPLKGCGHRYYCPLAISEFVPHMLGSHKESAMTMSLFDQVSTPATAATTPPAPPVMDAATHAAAVAAEKARLLAEDEGMVNTDQVAFENAWALVARGALRDAGNGQAFIQTGADSGWLMQPMTPIWRRALDQHAVFMANATPPAPVPVPAVPYVITPPDQPKTINMLDAAAPVPQAEIDQIADPALKAKVEQHAREHVARAATQAAADEAAKVAAGTSVWCPGGAQKIVVSTEHSVNGYTCVCTKHWKIKDKKLGVVKEGDQFVANIPRHKPANKEAQVEVAIAASAAASAAAPAAPTTTIAQFGPPSNEFKVWIATSCSLCGERQYINAAQVTTCKNNHASAAPAPTAPPVPPAPSPTTQETIADINNIVAVAPVPPVPAAPIAPPATPVMVQVNGNGYRHIEVDDRAKAAEVTDMTVYFVTTAEGTPFSVLAANMKQALALASDYLDGVDDDIIVSIEAQPGAVIEKAA